MATKPSTRMHSEDVCRALAHRHESDVFVDQCKTGATQRSRPGELQVMDAWAMAKSWAHPCVTCYEIKVTRSDFLGDKKWRGYLPYCNQMFFATPWKLVTPEELPGEECGLIWVTETGGRCVVKRPAKYREVEIPEDVWRYILMWRARITGDSQYSKVDKVQMIKDLLAKDAELKELGYMFARHVAKKAEKVEWENDRLKAENKLLAGVRDLLAELGFTDVHQLREWRMREQVVEALASMPPEWGKVRAAARRFIEVYTNVEKTMDALTGRADGDTKDGGDVKGG